MSTESLPNTERAHHPFSPSKLQMLEACPCFDNHQGPVNERAIAGTLAHAVTETGDDHFKLSDDDAAAAAECMDFYHREAQLMHEERHREVLKVAANLAEDFTGSGVDLLAKAEKRVPQVTEFTEIYLPVDDVVLEWCGKTAQATTAGYVDRGVIDHLGLHAKMFDWKFGMWPVEETDNNLQAIAYVLGLFKLHPKLISIQFFFKQPHLNYITSAVFTRAQIPTLYLRVQTVVTRAIEARKRGGFDMACPMAGVCNFCGNIGECPKVHALACTVGAKFYPLEIPENITPTFCDTPENSGKAMQLATVVKIWADAYRTQMSDRVLRKACEPPPGYTLSTRANRVVKDEAKAKEVSLRYVTEAEFQSVSPFPTFGKLEEIVKDKAPRGQKTIKLDEFKAALEAEGAVGKEAPYAFLRAVASRKDKETRDENEITD